MGVRRIAPGAARRPHAGRADVGRAQTLGERLDIVELREIAAAAGLGGSQGASVRRTLMAKARSLRSHALSGEETDARNRSKQMAMPLMAIAVAFLIFLFYPALAQLTSS